MKKIIKVSTNGLVDVLDAPESFDCRWLAKQIGCEWIEVVRPSERLEEGYVMIVDEEGLLKENCLNVAGSWLYGTDDHGEPIVGDLLIMKEEYGEDGPDLAGMSEESAIRFKEELGDFRNLMLWAAEINVGLSKE